MRQHQAWARQRELLERQFGIRGDDDSAPSTPTIVWSVDPNLAVGRGRRRRAQVSGRAGRSVAIRGRRRALAFLPLLAFVSYVTWVDLNWVSIEVLPLALFFGIVAFGTLLIMISGVFWRRFTDLPPATGRILCIVPAYNEEPEHVRETVLSLLRQTVRIDQIHVMDDGSTVPLQVDMPHHPRVHWHRQDNAGKRHAQAAVLRMFRREDWDYILTVDSDSIPDPDALEQILRAFTNTRVQAATAMILMRNWDTNLLTRLVDINIVSSCLMFRMIRSWFGIVTPTSGAFALYRSAIVYDNLDDYVTSGTAGDDRRLSFYSLLRGEVVGVAESVVETHLPDTWGGTFRQRMRWSKSAWLGIPFVTTNLRALPLFFYMYPLVFALMWPVVVVVLTKITVDYGEPAILYGFLFWEVVSITMTGIYAIYRPDLTMGQRLGQWLLSPLYPLLGLVILRPAAYWALTKLRSTSWHTRELKDSTGAHSFEDGWGWSWELPEPRGYDARSA